MNFPNSTFDVTIELNVLAYLIQTDANDFFSLTEKDFYNHLHRKAFNEIKAGQKPSPHKLIELGLKEESAWYIHETFPTHLDTQQNAKNLRQMTAARKLWYDSQKNMDNLNRATPGSLSNLVGSVDIANHVFPPSRAREEIKTRELALPIKFEPSTLNESFRSFNIGWMAMIAASTGVGKTSTAIQLSRSISYEEGSMCAYASLEMPLEDYLERAMSIRFYENDPFSNYPAWIAFRKTMTTDYLADYAVCDNEVIIDKPSLTISELKSEIIRLRAAGLNIRTVVIDHLYILTPEAANKSENQELSGLCKSIKAMAQELQVRAIVVGQTRKGDKDDRYTEPNLSDVRGSKAVTEDMWWVMLLWRDEHDKNIIHWKNAKYRNGEGVGDKGTLKCRGTYLYDDYLNFNPGNY